MSIADKLVLQRQRHLKWQAFDRLELALRVLESAPGPRTTVQSPLRWSENADWKRDYCNIERLSAEEIERRRAAFDKAKEQARRVKEQEALKRPGG